MLKTIKYWLNSGEKHPEKINKEIPVKIFFMQRTIKSNQFQTILLSTNIYLLRFLKEKIA